MNIDNNSHLYFITKKHPEWKDYSVEIRSTECGALSVLKYTVQYVSSDVKVAVCVIPGSEILARSVFIARNAIPKTMRVITRFTPDTGLINKIMIDGIPTVIEGKAT